MFARLPALSWKAFFRSMTPESQEAFEHSLAEAGLLMGEFIELVERAFLEASLLQEGSVGWERTDLPPMPLRPNY